MTLADITLNPALTDADVDRVLAWLYNPRAIPAAAWPATLAAFDRLGNSTVQWRGQAILFSRFYRRVIDEPFAGRLLEALRDATDVEVTGRRVAAELGRAVLAALSAQGLTEAASLPGQLLLAYCLYWWQAWAKGYTLEFAVYRDLEASGVAFTAHDPFNPAERYAPHDLLVLDQRGDIRASTYFVQTARTAALGHDFYITRLFDADRRLYRWAVLLQEAAWQSLNGEPIAGRWTDILRHWPQPVRVEGAVGVLIAVPYEVWKARVLVQQRGALNDERTIETRGVHSVGGRNVGRRLR